MLGVVDIDYWCVLQHGYHCATMHFILCWQLVMCGNMLVSQTFSYQSNRIEAGLQCCGNWIAR